MGFMGCGKSSIGRRLAARLGWEIMDTDKEAERRAGMGIPDIFAVHGEEWFRSLEEQIVEEAAACERDRVVALGGGTVCHDGVMEMLAGAGTTVYLRSSAGRLVRRMSEWGRANRPKIAGMGDEELTAYIEKSLPERELFYNKANFVLDCDALGDAAVVERLARAVTDEIKNV